MIAAARRDAIKVILMREKSARVVDLASEFQVSEETIRRDLAALERAGVVKKNYGGAVLAEEIHKAEELIESVHRRKLHLAHEKDQIGKAAASLVNDGQIIILDSGSTTWCVARHLRDREITVLTNGVTVAEEFGRGESSTVFMIGGKLIKKTMSLVGPQAERDIQRFSADYVFLGASGISIQKGYTSSDIYEAEVKRAMINSGKRTVIVADHSKINRQGLISFCSLGNVYALVTSDLADEAVLTEAKRLGVEVITVPVMDMVVG